MKHVSILVPRGHSSMVNIGGTHQMLSWVNGFFKKNGKEPPFFIQLVGLEARVRSIKLFSININAVLADVGKTNLIVIPAIHGDFDQYREDNADFIPWIVKRYKAGAWHRFSWLPPGYRTAKIALRTGNMHSNSAGSSLKPI